MAIEESHEMRPKGPLAAPKHSSHTNSNTQLKETKGELQIEPPSKKMNRNIQTFDSSMIPSPFLDASVLQRKKEAAKNIKVTKSAK